MSFISKATRTAHFLTQTFEPNKFGIKVLDRRISDFSKRNIGKGMSKEKFLCFEEFKQKRFDSLEDYTRRKKIEYPNATNEELDSVSFCL